MGTIFVDKLDPQSGTSLEIGSSGDTITIPSGATITNSGTATGFGQNNTPYFHARNGSDQDIGYTGVTTKINLNTEILDSDNAFDTSNYRFTPQTAGKYFIYGQIYFETNSSANNYNNLVTNGTIIQKNGSSIAHNYIFRGSQQFAARRRNLGTSIIVDMNGSTDYIELYGYANDNVGGSTIAAADTGGSCFLGGYFLAT